MVDGGQGSFRLADFVGERAGGGVVGIQGWHALEQQALGLVRRISGLGGMLLLRLFLPGVWSPAKGDEGSGRASCASLCSSVATAQVKKSSPRWAWGSNRQPLPRRRAD